MKRTFRGVMYGIVALECLTYLGHDMYLPALPHVAAAFGATPGFGQGTMAAWYAGSVLLQWILAPLSDQYGPRRCLMVGVLLLAGGSILCAWAANPWWFIIGRLCQGATGSVIWVSGYALIHTICRGKEAVRLLSVIGSVTLLAPAVGPLLGALLLQYQPWTSIFWLLGGLTLVCGAYLGHRLWVLPDACLPPRISWDLRGVLREYGAMMIQPTFLRYTALYGCCIMVILMWMLATPFILQAQGEPDPRVLGLLLSGVFSGTIMGLQSAKYAIMRFHSRRLRQVGMAVMAVGACGLWAMAAAGLAPGWMACMMAVICMGWGLMSGIWNRLTIAAVSGGMGRRTAVFSSLVGSCGILAAALVAFLSVQTFLRLAQLITGGVGMAIWLYWTDPAPADLDDERPDLGVEDPISESPQ